jgi:hypothetical protein
MATDYGAQVPVVQVAEVPPPATELPQSFETTTGVPPVHVIVVVFEPVTTVAIVVPEGSFTVEVTLLFANDLTIVIV